MSAYFELRDVSVRYDNTHASTTDPDARLYRKGRSKEAKLCHMGHLLMENRHGLTVDALLTSATGTAEREAAETMLGRQAGRHRATLGADKGYDAASFVAALRALNVTPHIAQNTSRRSAIDGRTTRHPGFALSQQVRKRIEERFGWIKTVAGLRQTRHRGTARVGWLFTLTAAACNVVRLPKLLAAARPCPDSPQSADPRPNGGRGSLALPAEAESHISANGNEVADHLISAAC